MSGEVASQQTQSENSGHLAPNRSVKFANMKKSLPLERSNNGGASTTSVANQGSAHISRWSVFFLPQWMMFQISRLGSGASQ